MKFDIKIINKNNEKLKKGYLKEETKKHSKKKYDIPDDVKKFLNNNNSIYDYKNIVLGVGAVLLMKNLF